MLLQESALHRRPVTADDVDDLRQPVSSVLAAYRQHTSASAMPPYWPAASSTPADVIVTSYGGAGYVVHPGTSAGLMSPWMTAPPSVDRLTEFSGGGGGGYAPHAVGVLPAPPPLSAYAGGVELKPWPANGYMNMTPPPSGAAVSSPHFHTIPRLTGTITLHARLYLSIYFDVYFGVIFKIIILFFIERHHHRRHQHHSGLVFTYKCAVDLMRTFLKVSARYSVL